MNLRAERIAGRSFTIVDNGYDRVAVDAFLDEVAESVSLAQAALEQLSGPPPEYVATVLQQARDSAREVTVEAERECAVQRRRAQEEAASLRRLAETYATEVTTEARQAIARLREQQEALRAQVMAHVEELRRRSAAEASARRRAADADADALRNQASERAEALTEEALTRVETLEDATERSIRDLLTDAVDRVAAVDQLERNLAELIIGYGSHVDQMRTLRRELL